MIIHLPQYHLSLDKFGIKIPLYDDRVEKLVERFNIKKYEGEIPELTKEDFLRAHDKEFIENIFSSKNEEVNIEIERAFELVDEQGEYHRYDPSNALLPLAKLRDNIIGQVSGSLIACEKALEKGPCFYLGGGMHHAHRDHGSGFCLVNDIVIAIRRLQNDSKIKNALVIDVDAHKGDGTASIVAGDQSISTLSLHMANAWPLDIRPGSVKSDIDLPMVDSLHYLESLEKGLENMRKMLVSSKTKIDLAVIVLGADPFEMDELPSTESFSLTLDELLQRDKMIFNFLDREKIPQSYLMGGGYGKQTHLVYGQFIERVMNGN